MAARIGNITFDCDDVLKLTAFWSAVLGRPLDNGSSEFFASIGGADGERQEPAWSFNMVPEPRRAKNRVHLDLVNPDPVAVDAVSCQLNARYSIASFCITERQRRNTAVTCEDTSRYIWQLAAGMDKPGRQGLMSGS